MKNLVVYYSWTGNTEVVAKEIHKLTSGDLIKIEEQKLRKPSSFLGSAISALLGLKSKLKPMDCSLSDYDNIFIGSQVWASHSTPAINAFLSMTDFTNKKVFLFMTLADDKAPQTVIDSITKEVEKRGGKVVDFIHIQTKMKSIITPEAVNKTVSDWISKVNL